MNDNTTKTIATLTTIVPLALIAGGCSIFGSNADDGEATDDGAASASDTTGTNAGGAHAGGSDSQGGAEAVGGQGGDSAASSSSSTSASSGSGGAPALPNGWTTSAHPCVGNRTDALWYDGTSTAYVGCGTTATGFGLYESIDGGLSWAAPATSPANFLDSWRVNHVHRSSDGLLYVAGTGPLGRMVVSVDTSSSPYEIAEVLNAGTKADFSFTVGTFLRAPDGSAVAESLTGGDYLFRPDDNAGPDPQNDGWVNAYYWAGGTETHGVMDMAMYDGEFYGTGSTIVEPPMVYLPDPNESDPWRMTTVQLANGIGLYKGEMWNIAIDQTDGTIVVGGINQIADIGMIYVSGNDPYEASDWTEYSVASLLPGKATWIRGVCANDGRIVVVGELQAQAEPIVLVSDDGGQSFDDLTPTNAASTALHRCVVFDDGSFAVTGAGGFVGIFTQE